MPFAAAIVVSFLLLRHGLSCLRCHECRGLGLLALGSRIRVWGLDSFGSVGDRTTAPKLRNLMHVEKHRNSLPELYPCQDVCLLWHDAWSEAMVKGTAVDRSPR